jgi:nucleotide-binding universal stress UspA family protein
MFKSILVPTDGSEASEIALEYGIQMAKSYEGRIIGLYVIESKNIYAPHAQGLGASPVREPHSQWAVEFRKNLEEMGKKTLKSLEGKCEENGVECETTLTEGVANTQICEQARRVDLVVMGGRGENAKWSGPLLGSTLESVIRQINKPVLISPSEPPKPIKKVLVTYDGSLHSNNALKVAVGFCSELKLPVLLLTVSDDEEKGTGVLNEALKYAEPYNLKVETLLRPGDPGEEIVKVSEEKDCDLIIMCAYGHSKIRDLILGSTTEQVMRKTTKPLLVYR